MKIKSQLILNVVRAFLDVKHPLYQNFQYYSTSASDAHNGRSAILECVSKNSLRKNICSTNFHHKNLIYPKILQSVVSIPVRTYGSRSNRFRHRKGKPITSNASMSLPRLIYIGNPFTWLVNKFYFTVLKSSWDPDFQESEFRRGSQQAIATVTNIISTQKYEDLFGLLTRPAKMRLEHEISTEWSGHQIKAIGMEPHHLQITVPRKVWFLRLANNSEKKYCSIDMVFIGLKFLNQHNDGIVFAEIFARFHRDYTENAIPEWTIAHFKVTRFQIYNKIKNM